MLKWLEENAQRGSNEPLFDGSTIVQQIDISCSDSAHLFTIVNNS
jgi:hypothetical protein